MTFSWIPLNIVILDPYLNIVPAKSDELGGGMRVLAEPGRWASVGAAVISEPPAN
jgi:hypothetical protein